MSLSTCYTAWTASVVEAADAAARVAELLCDVEGPEKYTSRLRASETVKIELITKLLEETTIGSEKDALKRRLLALQTSLAQIDTVANTPREVIMPYVEAVNRLQATLNSCQERIAGIQGGYGRHGSMAQAAEQPSDEQLVTLPPHGSPVTQQEPDQYIVHEQSATNSESINTDRELPIKQPYTIAERFGLRKPRFRYVQ
ncbi:hypothetical protein NLG97_g5618 [Lecanicillium saksenae]|uniref:Uncharacterized protein n=1 Tax=Lecanicillium saksenae TaxID=468837 RepID=A0ACC1QRY0_9HYPO|nr:hypothetical protein NLG97_g5618 [Lecanicillium saksenae]